MDTVDIHIVLDLDETLIRIDDLRPYAHEFLDFCFKNFASVSIWTAAQEYWWETNKERHFSNYNFKYVYTVDRCVISWFHGPYGYTRRARKPLRKIWKLKDNTITRHNVLIIDDNALNCDRNYGNAIIIEAWEGNDDDCELLYMIEKLGAIIKEYKKCGSVRKIQK